MKDNKKLSELGKYAEKIPKWESYQKNKTAFLEYLKDNLSIENEDEINLMRLIPRVEKCGSYMVFRNYFLQKEQKLVDARFCKKHTICQFCASRRATKGAVNLRDKANKVLSERPYLKPYYIVLTVKNEPDLEYGMRKLNGGWQRIRTKMKNARRALKTKKPENSKYASALNSEFARCTGGAYSIEVTWNEKRQDWHPHMNLLLLSETTMRNYKLSDEWQSYVPDSEITWCEEIDIEEDEGAFFEVMKYTLKFSEMPFKRNKEAYLALLGNNLTGSFGDFHGMNLEPDLEDEPLEGQPYIEILLRYFNGRYRKERERTGGIKKKYREPELA